MLFAENFGIHSVEIIAHKDMLIVNPAVNPKVPGRALATTIFYARTHFLAS